MYKAYNFAEAVIAKPGMAQEVEMIHAMGNVQHQEARDKIRVVLDQQTAAQMKRMSQTETTGQ